MTRSMRQQRMVGRFTHGERPAPHPPQVIPAKAPGVTLWSSRLKIIRLGRRSAKPIDFVPAKMDFVTIKRFAAIHSAGVDRQNDIAVVTNFKIGSFQRLVIDTEAISCTSGRANFHAHATLP